MKLLPPKRRAQSEAYRRAPHQEREAAKEMTTARRTALSGAGLEKGDVRLEGAVRLECKATGRKSYALSVEAWKALEEQALTAGEVPAMQIEFLLPDGTRTTLAVLPWSIALPLLT